MIRTPGVTESQRLSSFYAKATPWLELEPLTVIIIIIIIIVYVANFHYVQSLAELYPIALGKGRYSFNAFYDCRTGYLVTWIVRAQ